MMTWISIPFTGKVVVKNGDQIVRIIVNSNSRPTVRCGNCEFYPTSWRGVKKSEETVFWNFTLGPVKSVCIHTDKKGARWMRIVWK